MIENAQVTFQELVAVVRSQERIWVRIGAALKDKTWTVLAFDAVALAQPPDWEERTWKYPGVVFGAFVENGQNIADWLETGKVIFGNLEVALPDLPLENPNATIQAYGLASCQSSDSHMPLTWPTTSYTLPRSGGGSYVPTEMLIAEGAPSFLSFLDAAAAFLGLATGVTGVISQLPSSSIRIQDRTGRISSVVVHPTKVEVHLEGETLAGLTLELAGQVLGPQVRLQDRARCQTVELLTPDGLGAQAWVVLKTGATCVDRKFLNWQYSSPDPGVEIIEEPVSMIEALVAAGEGTQIEFKRQAPETPEERKKVCRTLAAFANDHGGHLLFGVDDDGQIVGINSDDDGRTIKDTVTRWIADLIAPHLVFSLDIFWIEDGLGVLHVEVQEGSSPPYGVDPAKPHYYIRRGATTFPASADDVRTMVRTSLA